MPPSVQDMGVDHSRADVFMAQQLLDGANVITGFEQMGGKGVAIMPNCNSKSLYFYA